MWLGERTETHTDEDNGVWHHINQLYIRRNFDVKFFFWLLLGETKRWLCVSERGLCVSERGLCVSERGLCISERTVCISCIMLDTTYYCFNDWLWVFFYRQIRKRFFVESFYGQEVLNSYALSTWPQRGTALYHHTQKLNGLFLLRDTAIVSSMQLVSLSIIFIITIIIFFSRCFLFIYLWGTVLIDREHHQIITDTNGMLQPMLNGFLLLAIIRAYSLMVRVELIANYSRGLLQADFLSSLQQGCWPMANRAYSASQQRAKQACD